MKVWADTATYPPVHTSNGPRSLPDPRPPASFWALTLASAGVVGAACGLVAVAVWGRRNR